MVVCQGRRTEGAEPAGSGRSQHRRSSHPCRRLPWLPEEGSPVPVEFPQNAACDRRVRQRLAYRSRAIKAIVAPDQGAGIDCPKPPQGSVLDRKAGAAQTIAGGQRFKVQVLSLRWFLIRPSLARSWPMGIEPWHFCTIRRRAWWQFARLAAMLGVCRPARSQTA